MLEKGHFDEKMQFWQTLGADGRGQNSSKWPKILRVVVFHVYIEI